MTTLRDLDRLVKARRLLSHPFYTAWTAGTLPVATLREYAGQYYHFEVNFPRYVAAAYARLERPSERSVLLENLVDEEGRSPTHPELWQAFARAIGAPRPGPSTPCTPGTRQLLQAYEEETLGGDAASALGALYAYESQFPEVAAEKSRGLRANYGYRSASAHEFFRVHTVADVAHSQAERSLLASHLRRHPSAGPSAIRGVQRSARAWWKFLDSFAL
jgi:pyrroloquinoline-quinone synthase